MKTTLKRLRAAGACVCGYNKLVRSLQGKPFTADDEERKAHIRWAHTADIPLLTIIDNNGLDDALFALRASDCTMRDARLFAVACARQAQHLIADQCDISSTLDVAERHANGLATDLELFEAKDAWDAARDVAWEASWGELWNAATEAAWGAAGEALGTISASRAARAAALDAARAIGPDAVAQLFRDMCGGCAPWQTA